ncbi:DNA-binding response OmpR family regulator [Spirosoma lacussanchae]|uniref:response regulator transcription factor n=1 Tax=Spirosoma lacussanchae TaxID=1884249 RepID=UPI001109DD6E|nr:response regulator [Spirosoma lacussanchae]
MENSYHVLHIDDDVFIRRIIEQALGAQFKITSFANGMEAMMWLESGNVPDIILTDLRMPMLDGTEMIDLIRSSSLYRHVPIIVLSSADDSALKVKCIDQGADDFIIKPFNPLEIEAKIKALLRRANDRRTFRTDFDAARLSPFRQ